MKRLILAVLAAAIILIVWLLIAPHLATYLVVERPLLKADAIIVLSGSAAYRERTRKAAELYAQGVSQHIFITNDGEQGGWSKSEQRNPRFYELEIRELTANGVLPEAISVLPGEVSGTDQEAKAMAAEIDARPIGSLLIVTSAYHTRRALRTFEKILGGRSIEIGIEYAPVNERAPKPETWWLGLRGWQTVGGEYIKSAVYWLSY